MLKAPVAMSIVVLCMLLAACGVHVVPLLRRPLSSPGSQRCHCKRPDNLRLPPALSRRRRPSLRVDALHSPGSYATGPDDHCTSFDERCRPPPRPPRPRPQLPRRRRRRRALFWSTADWCRRRQPGGRGRGRRIRRYDRNVDRLPTRADGWTQVFGPLIARDRRGRVRPAGREGARAT